MNWKIIRASMVGTSHIENGTKCQDCCWADEIQSPDNKSYLVTLVSDGAGSALEGAKGSELSCETLLESISYAIDQQSNPLSKTNVIKWIKDTRQAILLLAEKNNLTPRDYACTVLGAILTADEALFFQIGDGAIVVAQRDIFGVVFWPDSGEYANSTYFITDENALNSLRITHVKSKINEIALFSDGLQHLALSYDSKTPHPPFFEPMFTVMRQRKTSNCDDLDEQLKLFLNSDAMNARTDDDKTLVLASC